MGQIPICGVNQIDQTQGTVGMGFLVGIIILIFLAFSYKWFKYRNQFPIKERSPQLSFIILLSIAIYLATYPIYVIKCQIHLNSEITTSLITMVFYINQYSYPLVYLLRSCRIRYAYTRMENRMLTIFFKSETLIIVCFFLVLLINLIIFQLVVGTYPQLDFEDFNIDDLDFYQFLIFEYAFIWICASLSYYMMSKTEQRIQLKYQLKYLLIFIILTQVFFFTVIIITSFFKEDWSFSNCLFGSVPIIYTQDAIQGLIIIILSFYYPLNYVDDCHSMPFTSEVVLEPVNFNLFLTTLECSLAFSKVISKQREKLMLRYSYYHEIWMYGTYILSLSEVKMEEEMKKHQVLWLKYNQNHEIWLGLLLKEFFLQNEQYEGKSRAFIQEGMRQEVADQIDYICSIESPHSGCLDRQGLEINDFNLSEGPAEELKEQMVPLSSDVFDDMHSQEPVTQEQIQNTIFDLVEFTFYELLRFYLEHFQRDKCFQYQQLIIYLKQNAEFWQNLKKLDMADDSIEMK